MDKTVKIIAAVLAVVVVVGIAILYMGSQGSVSSGTKTTDPIYFFYGEECPHCHNVMPYIINMTRKYPDADIRVLEVWHNQTNQQIWVQATTAAGLSQYGVPEVISGTTVLIGEVEIPQKLEGLIQDSLKKKI